MSSVSRSDRSLVGRRCLITGATSGHGRAVALALAKRHADLVVLGRDRRRCDALARTITLASGVQPEVLLCDLSSRAEIDRAADTLLADERPLHLLVNNAGLVSRHRRETVDGLELTFAVNYLACFQLTLRLLDRLRASRPARIVNVASDMHRVASLDPDDLQYRRRYSALGAYGRSKLALVYFTVELARRLAGTGVTVNAVDPGPVASRIAADNPGLLPRVASALIQQAFPSPERAAKTAVWLASAAELTGATGGYYKFGTKRTPRLDPKRPHLGAELWRRSAELLGVDLK